MWLFIHAGIEINHVIKGAHDMPGPTDQPGEENAAPCSVTKPLIQEKGTYHDVN